ncbi:sarcosine reductase complex component B subunit beta [Striga asiatica]|uniref:Sarcosine reductase complex component B subunit beta n=1 Tax=Striga asiatica TaxID=4170 RepID=A0A5A7R1U3_STRAF|nr:sarcosine reductase complex component B subunit beta [Striga asiatica]
MLLLLQLNLSPKLLHSILTIGPRPGPILLLLSKPITTPISPNILSTDSYRKRNRSIRKITHKIQPVVANAEEVGPARETRRRGMGPRAVFDFRAHEFGEPSVKGLDVSPLGLDIHVETRAPVEELGFELEGRETVRLVAEFTTSETKEISEHKISQSIAASRTIGKSHAHKYNS